MNIYTLESYLQKLIRIFEFELKQIPFDGNLNLFSKQLLLKQQLNSQQSKSSTVDSTNIKLNAIDITSGCIAALQVKTPCFKNNYDYSPTLIDDYEHYFEFAEKYLILEKIIRKWVTENLSKKNNYLIQSLSDAMDSIGDVFQKYTNSKYFYFYPTDRLKIHIWQHIKGEKQFYPIKQNKNAHLTDEWKILQAYFKLTQVSRKEYVKIDFKNFQDLFVKYLADAKDNANKAARKKILTYQQDYIQQKVMQELYSAEQVAQKLKKYEGKEYYKFRLLFKDQKFVAALESIVIKKQVIKFMVDHDRDVKDIRGIVQLYNKKQNGNFICRMQQRWIDAVERKSLNDRASLSYISQLIELNKINHIACETTKEHKHTLGTIYNNIGKYNGKVVLPVIQGLSANIFGAGAGECAGFVQRFIMGIYAQEKIFDHPLTNKAIFKSLKAKNFKSSNIFFRDRLNHLLPLQKEVSQLQINSDTPYFEGLGHQFRYDIRKIGILITGRSLNNNIKKLLAQDRDVALSIGLRTQGMGHAIGFYKKYYKGKMNYYFFDSNSGVFCFHDLDKTLSFFNYYMYEMDYVKFYSRYRIRELSPYDNKELYRKHLKSWKQRNLDKEEALIPHSLRIFYNWLSDKITFLLKRIFYYFFIDESEKKQDFCKQLQEIKSIEVDAGHSACPEGIYFQFQNKAIDNLKLSENFIQTPEQFNTPQLQKI